MTTCLQPSPPASTNQPRGLLMSAIPALVKRLIPKFQEVGFAVGFACIHIRHKLPGHRTASNRWIQRPKLKCHSLAHGMRLLHIQCCSMNLQLTQSLSKAWKADDCYSTNNNNRKEPSHTLFWCSIRGTNHLRGCYSPAMPEMHETSVLARCC